MTDRDPTRCPADDQPALQRRVLLRGVAVGGAAAAGGALLAACGDDAPADGAATPQPTVASPSTPGGSGGGDSEVLVATDEVPEGGGVILADAAVVVTQPAAGEFKGFSTVCTHKGCTVADIADGAIICPCHGSQYSVDDGSVLAGPAPAPLPEVPVTVKGSDVVRA